MKGKELYSFRGKLNGEWRPLTKDFYEIENTKSESIGQLFDDLQTRTALQAREIIELQAENEQLKSDIKLAFRGIEEITKILKGEK